MNRCLLFLFLAVCSLSSCKSKKTVAKASQSPSRSVSGTNYAKSEFLIRADSSDLHFQTFDAKGRADISINGAKNAASINIRIKKDQIIWAYISLGFIPIAQAYITPDSVKVKNLIQGNYVHKDFSYIQQYSSSMLNFQTLQAILTGNTPKSLVFSDALLKVLTADKYELSGHKDSLEVTMGYTRLFKMEDILLNNRVMQQNLHIAYTNFAQVNGANVPQTIEVSSRAGANEFGLNLNYRKITLNERLDFPFKAPGN